jgi:hypothetical protein
MGFFSSRRDAPEPPMSEHEATMDNGTQPIRESSPMSSSGASSDGRPSSHDDGGNNRHAMMMHEPVGHLAPEPANHAAMMAEQEHPRPGTASSSNYPATRPTSVATKKRSFFRRRGNQSFDGGADSSAASVLSAVEYQSTTAGAAPSLHEPEGDAHHGPHAITTDTAVTGGHSHFSRPSSSSRATSILGRKKTLHRTFGHGHIDDIDPSIAEARDRVLFAEAAERDADRALAEARASVREARENIRRIEEEAREEARRAVIKHQQAREITRRGKTLGRHME